MNRRKFQSRTVLAEKIRAKYASKRPPAWPYRVRIDGGDVTKQLMQGAQTRDEARQRKREWTVVQAVSSAQVIIERRIGDGAYERIR